MDPYSPIDPQALLTHGLLSTPYWNIEKVIVAQTPLQFLQFLQPLAIPAVSPLRNGQARPQAPCSSSSLRLFWRPGFLLGSEGRSLGAFWGLVGPWVRPELLDCSWWCSSCRSSLPLASGTMGVLWSPCVRCRRTWQDPVDPILLLGTEAPGAPLHRGGHGLEDP